MDVSQRVVAHLAQYRGLKKVLLIPPDATRAHSGAGDITWAYYQTLAVTGVVVDILPALGTHKAMSQEELLAFFGPIPYERFIVHNWREDIVQLGEIPADVVAEISQGILTDAIPVEVATPLVQGGYDLIISIGQVVPHEVVGMANYTKNIVVGCGGAGFISASHVLGAFYGIEKILGQVETPVRHLFDYAQEHFLATKLPPLDYLLTVTVDGKIKGLYTGRGRDQFERAAQLSQQLNINYVENPPATWVVNLPEEEFSSTWLGNKAVYRTRMAIPEGGHLIVIAPGVTAFGEDAENDRLIRKYGYQGLEAIRRLSQTEADLGANLSAAAHLIHGASEGKFTITYAAPKLGKAAVEGVGYQYMDMDKALEIAAQPDVYYVDNPAVGLWMKAV